MRQETMLVSGAQNQLKAKIRQPCSKGFVILNLDFRGGSMERKVYICLLLIPFLFTIFSCEKAPRIEGMVYIPSGEFIMGSADVDTEGLGK